MDADIFTLTGCLCAERVSKVAKNHVWLCSHTVSADVLAPLGARTSAGTAMTKFGFV